MAPPQSVLDALIGDFGNNYGFALELLEQYRREPGALDPSWQEYFARLPGEPRPGPRSRPRPPSLPLRPRRRSRPHRGRRHQPGPPIPERRWWPDRGTHRGLLPLVALADERPAILYDRLDSSS